MTVRRFGDWDKAKALLTNGFNRRLALAIRQATIKNALLLVREIKRGIRDQAPGGKAFAPLAQITIDRKGSSKALIDTGFLLNAITQKILSDGAFVGLLRTSIHKGGESVAKAPERCTEGRVRAAAPHRMTITKNRRNKMETKPNTVELTPETAAADIRILIEPLGDIDAIDTLSAAGVIDGNLADSMIYTARELRDRLSTCRDVVVASLADGRSHIRKLLDSADTRAAVTACRLMGARITTDDHWVVRGVGGRPHVPDDVIDVGNSGTTLYIALAAACLADVQEHYNSMRGRFVPQSRYLCDLAEAYSLCDQQTIIVTYYSERPSRAPHYLTARAPHTRRLGELLAELAAAAAWTERGITGAVATATAGRDPEQLREMVDAVRSAAEKAIE